MMKRYSALTAVIVLLAQCQSAPAILTLADGRYHVIDYRVGTIVQIDYNARGARTRVDLVEGGRIAGWVDAYEDSRFNIYGGEVYDRVKGHDRSDITLSGGTIALSVTLSDSSWMGMQGGMIGWNVTARDSAKIRMSGGEIKGTIRAEDYAWITILGGAIDDNVDARNNARITISGGNIGGDLTAGSGGLITLDGSGFSIDGVPVGYGDFASDFGTSGTITGVLANGDSLDNPYKLWLSASDITFVPEPATILTLALGGAAVFGKNRRKKWISNG